MREKLHARSGALSLIWVIEFLQNLRCWFAAARRPDFWPPGTPMTVEGSMAPTPSFDINCVSHYIDVHVEGELGLVDAPMLP